MAYEIVMPQLGLTMTEGSVSTWLKKPGDWVEKGEILFTVQTDKVEMEVESFGSGYLSEILVESELLVPVGTLLATLSDTATAAASPEPAGKIVASPRPPLAKELGVDLATAGERRPDLRRRCAPAFRTVGRRTKPCPAEELAALQGKVVHLTAGHSAGLLNARKITARRMTESFQSAPHFYMGVEANASVLNSLRQALNAEAPGNPKLTFTDFFLKAFDAPLISMKNFISGRRRSTRATSREAGAE
jgi:pyruvate/2-oxoglutarate dehydrogenase complex dihydrolipoamide acyltransferase (E2) component